MLKKLALAGSLALAAATQQAQAQVLIDVTGSPVCGGGTFLSCFTAKLEITSFTATSTTFQLWLQNRSAGSVFTQIGVAGLNPTTGYSMLPIAVSITGSPSNSFGTVVTGPNGLSGAGIDAPVFGIDAGGNNGLTSNGIAQFSFSLNKGKADLDLAGVQIAVHDQGAPYGNADCGSSNKAVYERGGSETTRGSFVGTQSTCGGTPTITNVVPEPSTYALMTAGLLGIFGVARRRRNAAQV
ncbi:MAG: PEP-CTERM sorting domain-containing protein [Gemmatimonadaceae bacterium]|nr:PEP-CTERM sorting domain-containing protein [Gemmatimonadaceae bacterium]